MRTVSFIRRLWYQVILLLFFVACDSFRPEPGGQFKIINEFYVLPGSSIVIDLKSIVTKAFSTVLLSVSQDPLRGTLTQLDPFLLKYTPNASFLDGTDQFALSVTLDNGAMIKTEPVTIFMKQAIGEFPCDMYAIEDYARVRPNESIAVHPLANDRICDVNGSINVFIYLEPKFGSAVVVGDSIIYTPGQSFSEGDELVYSASSGGDGVAYGIVSINKSRLETFPISGFKDIHFVNDSLGFIAGGSTILKTTDGGKNWIEVTYPKEGNDVLIDIKDIYFLDEQNGFAAFSRCTFSDDENCQGGWLRTWNGGVSWQRFEFHQPVNSIFFTTALIGFMGTSEPDSWDISIRQTVWKTVDGGETWDAVYSPVSYFEKIKIRFANENVGYAYHLEGIYKTVDGGKTWRQYLLDRYVGSLSVTAENIVSATLNSTLSETTTGTIIRSEDGSNWTPVISYPYSILVHDFSPDGGLGAAVGISETKAAIGAGQPLLTLSISISTNEGKTWADLSLEGYGFPQAISIPSSHVAYILCLDRIIKYSR